MFLFSDSVKEDDGHQGGDTSFLWKNYSIEVEYETHSLPVSTAHLESFINTRSALGHPGDEHFNWCVKSPSEDLSQQNQKDNHMSQEGTGNTIPSP